MSIDDAIKQLQDAKESGVRHIVLAYWEADMFDREDDDSWAACAQRMEDIDWSMTHDMLSDELNRAEAN
jgi:hypothetical protein